MSTAEITGRYFFTHSSALSFFAFHRNRSLSDASFVEMRDTSARVRVRVRRQLRLRLRFRLTCR